MSNSNPAGDRVLNRAAAVQLGLYIGLMLLITAASADEFDIDLAAVQEVAPPTGTIIGAENVKDYIDVVDPDLAGLIAQGWLPSPLASRCLFDHTSPISPQLRNTAAKPN